MVCFFQFCDVATLEIRPQEESAKFGYRSESNTENFKHPAIFWWPAETYCLNMVISDRKNNPLYVSFWIFFCCQVVKFFSWKNIHWNQPPLVLFFSYRLPGIIVLGLEIKGTVTDRVNVPLVTTTIEKDT